MKSICIFCGAKEGTKPEYKQASIALVEELVSRDITIIYGGCRTGIMGVVADHALKLGGKVIGIMPENLVDLELTHEGLTELHFTEDMHDRKKLLAQMSDGFIALPGGTGTLDELFQEVALRQTGYHDKTCGLLNVANYYEHLIAFLNHATTEGFLNPQWREYLIINDSPTQLLSKLLE